MACSGEVDAPGQGSGKTLKVALDRAFSAAALINITNCELVGVGTCPEGQTCGYVETRRSVESWSVEQSPEGQSTYTVNGRSFGKCQCQQT